MRLRKITALIILLLVTANINLMADDQLDQGIELLNRGKFIEAIDILSQIVMKDPDNAEAMTNLAMAHLYLNMYEEAAHYLDMLIAKDNSNPELYNMRGMARGSMHKLQLAVMDFTEAVKLAPDYVQAYLNRGSAYTQLKRWNNAVRDFNVVISHNTDNPDVYYQRGKCNYKLNKLNEAVNDFSSSIDMGYDFFATIYYERGNCYFKAGQFGKAVKDYTKCLKIDPYSMNALNNRAVAHEKLGRKKEAEADRSLALKYSSPDKYMPDPEKMPLKRYQTRDGKISIELPKGWHMEQKTENGVTRLLLSLDKPSSNGEYHVGAELTLSTDLKKRFGISGTPQVLQLFEENNRLSAIDYVEYNLLEKKSFPLGGNNCDRDYYGVKRDKFHQAAGLYVVYIPMEDDLFYGYMKAPSLMFGYYRLVFDRAIKTIRYKP